jgi:hypothetical protein
MEILITLMMMNGTFLLRFFQLFFALAILNFLSKLGIKQKRVAQAYGDGRNTRPNASDWTFNLLKMKLISKTKDFDFFPS